MRTRVPLYSKMTKFVVQIILFLLCISIKLSFEQHRSKRFLTFPPTSPTRVQVNQITQVVHNVRMI